MVKKTKAIVSVTAVIFRGALKGVWSLRKILNHVVTILFIGGPLFSFAWASEEGFRGPLVSFFGDSNKVVDLNERRRIQMTYVIFSRVQGSSIEKILLPAMDLIRQSSPPFFKIEKQVDHRLDFNLMIEIVDSKQEAKNLPGFRDSDFLFSESTTSSSWSVGTRGPYVVRIVWDRVMNEENRDGLRVERPDAFARLLVSLAREIYGNVYTMRTQVPGRDAIPKQASATQGFRSRAENEIRASRAAIAFIDRVLRQLRSQLYGPTAQNLYLAREREQMALRSWIRGLDYLASLPGSLPPPKPRPMGQLLQFRAKTCSSF